jgi:hypothetical protein
MNKFIPSGHQYNLRKDDPNHPDKVERRITAPSTFVLPSAVSQTYFMGPIRDQGNEGACTGELKSEYLDCKYRHYYSSQVNKTVPPSTFMASARFAYVTNLIADGDFGKDNGSTIHQSFVTMNSLGICLDSQDPYTGTASDYSTQPTAAQYADALIYKGDGYFSLPTLQEVKMTLSGGQTVGIGINVYESFESTKLANTGFMVMPKAKEQLLGGHAQHVLAYSDLVQFPDGQKGGVFIQNSWGTSWGLSSVYQPKSRGCYWMPYAFFTYVDPNGNGTGVSDMWFML